MRISDAAVNNLRSNMCVRSPLLTWLEAV